MILQSCAELHTLSCFFTQPPQRSLFEIDATGERRQTYCDSIGSSR